MANERISNDDISESKNKSRMDLFFFNQHGHNAPGLNISEFLVCTILIYVCCHIHNTKESQVCIRNCRDIETVVKGKAVSLASPIVLLDYEKIPLFF